MQNTLHHVYKDTGIYIQRQKKSRGPRHQTYRKQSLADALTAATISATEPSTPATPTDSTANATTTKSYTDGAAIAEPHIPTDAVCVLSTPPIPSTSPGTFCNDESVQTHHVSDTMPSPPTPADSVSHKPVMPHVPATPKRRKRPIPRSEVLGSTPDKPIVLNSDDDDDDLRARAQQVRKRKVPDRAVAPAFVGREAPAPSGTSRKEVSKTATSPRVAKPAARKAQKPSSSGATERRGLEPALEKNVQSKVHGKERNNGGVSGYHEFHGISKAGQAGTGRPEKSFTRSATGTDSGPAIEGGGRHDANENGVYNHKRKRCHNEETNGPTSSPPLTQPGTKDALSRTLTLFTTRLTTTNALLTSFTTAQTKTQNALHNLPSSVTPRFATLLKQCRITQEIIDLTLQHSTDVLIEQKSLEDEIEYANAGDVSVMLGNAEMCLRGLVGAYAKRLGRLLKELDEEAMERTVEQVRGETGDGEDFWIRDLISGGLDGGIERGW